MEHFRAKWMPVRVKKMRPNKETKHFRAKRMPVRVKKMRSNKETKHFRADPVRSENTPDLGFHTQVPLDTRPGCGNGGVKRRMIENPAALPPALSMSQLSRFGPATASAAGRPTSSSSRCTRVWRRMAAIVARLSPAPRSSGRAARSSRISLVPSSGRHPWRDARRRMRSTSPPTSAAALAAGSRFILMGRCGRRWLARMRNGIAGPYSITAAFRITTIVAWPASPSRQRMMCWRSQR